MDGLDTVHATFQIIDGSWSFQIGKAETIPFPQEWQARLSKIASVSSQDLLIADLEFGRWVANVTNDFIHRNSITADLVASHGHTIFHQPERNLTYQIGNGSVIAVETGFTVVNDFRTLDMALGGQGAPLVPIGDKLLFGEFDFCLNLGGIANISYDHGGQRVALDICPLNQVLNHLSRRMSLAYDEGGKLANAGRMDQLLLNKLNALLYYKKQGPKSLGREWIEKEVLSMMDAHPGTIPDLLCTFNHHAAFQIAEVVTSEIRARSSQSPCTLLVTGGGAYNSFLIGLLKEMTAPTAISVPEDLIVDFKEALVFGFMGVLRVRNEINCYMSVTGASADSSLGQVWQSHPQ